MAATIFTHPESVGDPPAWESGKDFHVHMAEEQAWEQEVVKFAKTFGTGKYAGEIFSWPMGDGRASYVVFRLKPLEMIWLSTGDAWDIPDVVARGLTAADVRKQIDGERRWQELVAEQQQA